MIWTLIRDVLDIEIALYIQISSDLGQDRIAPVVKMSAVSIMFERHSTRNCRISQELSQFNIEEGYSF